MKRTLLFGGIAFALIGIGLVFMPVRRQGPPRPDGYEGDSGSRAEGKMAKRVDLVIDTPEEKATRERLLATSTDASTPKIEAADATVCREIARAPTRNEKTRFVALRRLESLDPKSALEEARTLALSDETPDFLRLNAAGVVRRAAKRGDKTARSILDEFALIPSLRPMAKLR